MGTPVVTGQPKMFQLLSTPFNPVLSKNKWPNPVENPARVCIAEVNKNGLCPDKDPGSAAEAFWQSGYGGGAPVNVLKNNAELFRQDFNEWPQMAAERSPVLVKLSC